MRNTDTDEKSCCRCNTIIPAFYHFTKLKTILIFTRVLPCILLCIISHFYTALFLQVAQVGKNSCNKSKSKDCSQQTHQWIKLKHGDERFFSVLNYYLQLYWQFQVLKANFVAAYVYLYYFVA